MRLELLLQGVQLADLQLVAELQQLGLLLAHLARVVQGDQHHHQRPVLHEAAEDGRGKRMHRPVAHHRLAEVEVAPPVQDAVVDRAGHHLVEGADEQAEPHVDEDDRGQRTPVEGPALQDAVDQGREQCPEQEVQVGHRGLPPPIEIAHVLQFGIHVVVHVGLRQEQGGHHQRGDQDHAVPDRGALEVVHRGPFMGQPRCNGAVQVADRSLR